jgi:histidinol dehydrogenase
MVFGAVGIDSLAGPSEIVVLADASADPTLIAAELLSQAEHSRDAVAVAVSDSASLLAEVENKLEEQLLKLDRAQTARAALAENGAFVKVESLEQGIEFVNLFAPEHLQLAVSQPKETAEKIRNAGAIFLGQTTPEAFGDYLAGPSHVLPTGGTALFSSPLTVFDFLKCSSLIMSSKDSLGELAPHAITLAEAEGLNAHAQSLRAAAGLTDMHKGNT